MAQTKIALVLTSNVLTPGEESTNIDEVLQAAAEAVIPSGMPQLEIMKIWNGRKGVAALFQYQASCINHQATITWRGTWDLAIRPSVFQAWEAVIQQQYDGWKLNVVQERLDQTAIKPHGEAIHFLGLSGEVIRPVALQQIRMEQKALEGVETV